MWLVNITLNSGKSLMVQRAPHSQLLPIAKSAPCENPSPSFN